jgi:hypothetical protein
VQRLIWPFRVAALAAFIMLAGAGPAAAQAVCPPPWQPPCPGHEVAQPAVKTLRPTGPHWTGFRPVQDVAQLGLPFGDFFRDAVFEIYTIGLVDSASQRPNIIDTNAVPPVTDPKVLAVNPIAWQVETCRNQGLRYCPVLGNDARGTAFVLAGDMLYTCRHLMQNWLVWASQANGNIALSKLSPPMRILDRSKNVVYDSAMAPRDAMLRFALINDDPRLAFEYREGDPALTKQKKASFRRADVVGLKSSKPLAPGFTPRTLPGLRTLLAGQSVYYAGYPGKTDYYRSGPGDTPGGILVASSGVALATSDTDNALLSTAPTYVGGSGGPLVTENGDLIGLACSASNLAINGGLADVRSITTYLSDSRLAELWRTMDYPPLGASK